MKVRFLCLLALATAVGTGWWGWNLFGSYGLNPGDGGLLAPVGTRIAMGVMVASIGIIFVGGMAVYARHYVSRLTYDGASGTLRLTTLRLFGSREAVLGLGEVTVSSYLHGRLINPLGVSVHAPWYTLRVKGRGWPLILDAQGVFPEPRLALRLLKIGGAMRAQG